MKYLLAVLILVGCRHAAKRDEAIKPAPLPDRQDTVTWRPANLNASPVLFEAAFIKGTKAKVKDTETDLYGITIGTLKLPSGRIIACDPTLMEEYGLPFTQQFPTGEFPVQLAIVKLGADESIAFARISFSTEPVARWEYALQKGNAPIPLKGKERYGYTVDAGVGTFLDSAAAAVLEKEKITSLNAGIYQAMLQHAHNDWRYNMYDFGSNNMAVLSTGFGDGNYATYIGFDAAGKPCRLLTDFEIFEWK